MYAWKLQNAAERILQKEILIEQNWMMRDYREKLQRQ